MVFSCAFCACMHFGGAPREFLRPWLHFWFFQNRGHPDSNPCPALGSCKYLYAQLLDMEGPAGLPSGLRPGRPARGPGFDPRFGVFVRELPRAASAASSSASCSAVPRQCHGSATAVTRQ